MTHKIAQDTAQTQFDRIIDQAVEHNDRFLVEREGEPAVVILSVADFVTTLSPTPDWLREVQADAALKGTDKLTTAEIDAEIAASRRERARQSRPA
jgi:PHD/YefM family antitoxin component YafN of YafNO toxin-antitoxin module